MINVYFIRGYIHNYSKMAFTILSSESRVINKVAKSIGSKSQTAGFVSQFCSIMGITIVPNSWNCY